MGQRNRRPPDPHRPVTPSQPATARQPRSVGAKVAWGVGPAVVSVGSGAALGLVFPASTLWWWTWVGLSPVLVVVAQAPTARTAAWRTVLAGSGFTMVAHHWLVGSLGVFMVPAAVIMALLWLPVGLTAHHLLRTPLRPAVAAVAVVVIPSVWVVTDVVRSWHVLGGTWAMLGTSQAPVPALLAPAATGGVWLVTAVLVAANTAVAVSLRAGRGAVRPLAATAAVAFLAATAACGVARGDPPAVGALVVTGVQPGVVDDGGDRLDANLQLTDTIEVTGVDVTGVDIVVWGQSSVAFDVDADIGVRDRLLDATNRLGIPLLVNTDGRGPQGRITKTSVLFRPGVGPTDRYAKQRLVPFGEYIPARALFGWVERFTDAAAEDRLAGGDLELFDVGGVAVGPLVSYESTFGDLRRNLVRRGADIVIVQAASTTFQGSWAQPQQAAAEAVRAVESGRSTVFVAVSGTSAAFDASGHKLAWMPADDTGTFTVAAPVVTGETTYVRFGNWVGFVAAVVCAAAAGLGVQRLVAVRRTNLTTAHRSP